MQNIADLISSREKVVRVIEQNLSQAHSSLHTTPGVVRGASVVWPVTEVTKVSVFSLD